MAYTEKNNQEIDAASCITKGGDCECPKSTFITEVPYGPFFTYPERCYECLAGCNILVRALDNIVIN